MQLATDRFLADTLWPDSQSVPVLLAGSPRERGNAFLFAVPSVCAALLDHESACASKYAHALLTKQSLGFRLFGRPTSRRIGGFRAAIIRALLIPLLEGIGLGTTLRRIDALACIRDISTLLIAHLLLHSIGILTRYFGRFRRAGLVRRLGRLRHTGRGGRGDYRRLSRLARRLCYHVSCRNRTHCHCVGDYLLRCGGRRRSGWT